MLYNLYNNTKASSALSVIIVSGLFFCGYKKNPPALPVDFCFLRRTQTFASNNPW